MSVAFPERGQKKFLCKPIKNVREKSNKVYPSNVTYIAAKAKKMNRKHGVRTGDQNFSGYEYIGRPTY